MRTKHLRILVAVMLSFTFLLSALPASAATSEYKFDFSKTLKPWTPAADKLPIDEHTLVLKTDLKTNSFAALSAPRPGTVWMMAVFPGGKSKISLTFQAARMSNDPSVWIMPLVYVGTTPPVSVKDFVKVGLPLSDQWETYTYESAITINPKDPLTAPIYVAIGYKTYKPAWAGIDDVSILFTPVDW